MIKKGAYIKLGNYLGASIIWRCIGVNDGIPMLLSDKILCLKPFSANGEGFDDDCTKKYGSNFWGKSSLREWLNSQLSTVNYTHKPDRIHVYRKVNSYDTEAGFLSNFTEEEIAIIKDTSHNVLLADVDATSKDGGSESHYYDRGKYSDDYYIPSNIAQNYDVANYKNFTDKFFLPSIKDIQNMKDMTHADGKPYFMAYPTAEAVSHNTWRGVGVKTSNFWYYWLDTPSSARSYCVRYVNSDGGVNSYNAYFGSCGVRPALNLKSGISTSLISSHIPQSTNSFLASFTTELKES